MEYSRPENWSGQPIPSPGDLPNPGIGPRSPVATREALYDKGYLINYFMEYSRSTAEVTDQQKI